MFIQTIKPSSPSGAQTSQKTCTHLLKQTLCERINLFPKTNQTVYHIRLFCALTKQTLDEAQRYKTKLGFDHLCYLNSTVRSEDTLI